MFLLNADWKAWIYITKRESRRKEEGAVDFLNEVQFFLSHSAGDKGLVKRKKKKKEKSQCVIKDWQLSEKKRWNFQKEHNTLPLSLSPLHTHLRSPSLPAPGDNNGSWRRRCRRLRMLTAFWVMSSRVWLSDRRRRRIPAKNYDDERRDNGKLAERKYSLLDLGVRLDWTEIVS